MEPSCLSTKTLSTKTPSCKLWTGGTLKRKRTLEAIGLQDSNTAFQEVSRKKVWSNGCFTEETHEEGDHLPRDKVADDDTYLSDVRERSKLDEEKLVDWGSAIRDIEEIRDFRTRLETITDDEDEDTRGTGFLLRSNTRDSSDYPTRAGEADRDIDSVDIHMSSYYLNSDKGAMRLSELSRIPRGAGVGERDAGCDDGRHALETL